VYLGRVFGEINQPVVLRLSQQTFVRLQVFRAIADARRMPSQSDRPGNNEPAHIPGARFAVRRKPEGGPSKRAKLLRVTTKCRATKDPDSACMPQMAPIAKPCCLPISGWR